jgi:hypothetical protein
MAAVRDWERQNLPGYMHERGELPPGEDRAPGFIHPRTFWALIGLIAMTGVLCCYWGII